MVITFRSKKSILFYIATIGGVLVTAIGFAFLVVHPVTNFFILLICGLAITFLVWVFFDTKYQLDQNYLTYKTGPIKGKIEVINIKQITLGQRWFVGFKPATGSNGLVIKYNRWDEIYISPMHNEDFIKEILKINATIEIVYPNK